MKLFLINITFIVINVWYFSSPSFIIIKRGTEWCNSTTHILLTILFTLNQINNQIAIAAQNLFFNVKRFTFILLLKSIDFLNKRTNLASRSTTRRSFIIWRWFSPANHRRVISKSFTMFFFRSQKNLRLIKDILKILRRKMVSESKDKSSILSLFFTFLTLSNKVSLEKGLALNLTRPGFFKGSFFWGEERGSYWPPLPPIFIFQEVLIQYQSNFMQLSNNLFKVC